MNPKKNREKMIEVSSPRVESGSVCRWHAAGQGNMCKEMGFAFS